MKAERLRAVVNEIDGSSTFGAIAADALTQLRSPVPATVVIGGLKVLDTLAKLVRKERRS